MSRERSSNELTIVLGMHRSGTSAITRSLGVLGYSFGDNLMARAPGNNSRGFFEDLDVQRLNQAILTKLSEHWAGLAEVPSAALRSDAVIEERRQTAAMLTRKLDAAGRLAIKDPRFSLTLPAWHTAIERVEVDPSMVLAVRNPLEVAFSLRDRDRLPIEHGVRLWAKYTSAAIRHTDGMKRLVVAYDDLMADSIGHIVRLAAWLGVPEASLDEAALSAFSDDFLDKSLRHQLSSTDELRSSAAVPKGVVEAYTELREGARHSEPDWRAIEAALADTRIDSPALLALYDQTRLHGEAERRRRIEDADGLKAQKAHCEEVEKSAQKQLTEQRVAHEQALAKTKVAGDEAAKKLEASILEADGLRSEILAAQSREQTLEAAASAKAAQLGEQVAALGNRIEDLQQAATAARFDARAERDAALRDVRSELEQRARDAKVDADATIDRLSAEVLAGKERETAAVREARLARASVTAMKRSFPWRATKPMRLVAGLFGLGSDRGVRTAVARRLWRSIPLSPARRGRLASALVRLVPGVRGELAALAGPAASAKRGGSGAVPKSGPDRSRPAIAIVVHDLNRSGAQFLALNLAQVYRNRMDMDVHVIALKRGVLAKSFQSTARLHIVDEANADRHLEKIVSKMHAAGLRRIIINSIASGRVAPIAKAAGLRVVTLIHELPQVIQDMGLERSCAAASHSDVLVVPSRIVSERLISAGLLDEGSPLVVRPQGVYARADIADDAAKERARASLKDRCDLPDDSLVVLGAGYADDRKGFDTFVSWARAAAMGRARLRFVWIGEIDPAMKSRLFPKRGETRRLPGNLFLPGHVADPAAWHAGADIFALTSREDPFPSVALEALSARTPVVMVDQAGGIQDLVPSGAVTAVSDRSFEAFANGACDWIDNPLARAAAGEAGQNLMDSSFGFVSYAAEILSMLSDDDEAIGAVVPNFQYAPFLSDRIASVTNQISPPRKVAFLDDASTDDSLEVALPALRGGQIDFEVDVNVENGGNVFAQWRRGVARLDTPLVWIAEADDDADCRLLRRLALVLTQNPDVAFACCGGTQIDGQGRATSTGYPEYLGDLDADWDRPFIALPGRDDGLFAIKNPVPNVSAVLFRRDALSAILEEHGEVLAGLRTVGDWFVYFQLYKSGGFAYTPEPLNRHRRHPQSVTTARFSLKDLGEIRAMQTEISASLGVSGALDRRSRAYAERLAVDYGLVGRYGRDVVADLIASPPLSLVADPTIEKARPHV